MPGPHTATVQVALNEEIHTSSFEYMDRVRRKMHQELPELSTYFQSGGMVDAVLNQGLPAPIDVQVSGSNLEAAHQVAEAIGSGNQEDSGRQRRVHPSGSRLSVPAARH